jgi:2-(1,2-epoxy-1,2-dihydrophenyl)acetyl-CoA isomerase
MKEAIYLSANSSLDHQLKIEQVAMSELGRSEDYAEGVQAFLEKRAPVFHGR